MGFRYFAACLWALSVAVIALSFPLALLVGWEVPVVGSMFHRQELASNITPVLILLLFMWTLVELLLRERRVTREHASLHAFRDHEALLGKVPLAPQGGTTSPSRGHKRADAILKASAANSTGGTDTLQKVLPAMASLDAQGLASSYGGLQVYAWILPVLGFIGTALGMAKAIGGFRSAMLDAENTDKILQQLADSVIPGLASAFATTILALAASLVVYLCATALRDWDQEALDGLNESSVRYLARLPASDEANLLREIRSSVRDLCDRLGRFNETTDSLQNAASSVSTSAATLSGAAVEVKLAAKELQDAASQPFIIARARVQ